MDENLSKVITLCASVILFVSSISHSIALLRVDHTGIENINVLRGRQQPLLQAVQSFDSNESENMPTALRVTGVQIQATVEMYKKYYVPIFVQGTLIHQSNHWGEKWIDFHRTYEMFWQYNAAGELSAIYFDII